MSDAVRRQFQDVLAQYQPLLPSWPALTGNVLGVVAVSGRPGWIHVRVGSDQIPGQAYNNRVPNRNDLAVIVGYAPEQPGLFQVLAIREVYAGADSGDEQVPQVVAHHQTHEFGGGDEVWVQKKQFVPLQATPTSPQSMKIWVQADVYPWGSAWNWFPRTVSADFTARIAGSLGKARYVLVSIDGATNALQYTNGDIFTVLLPPPDIGDLIPAPPAGSVPIAAVYLPYGTTYLDWDSFYDVRLFNQPVGGSLLPSVHDHSTDAQGGQNLRDIQEFQVAAATELTIAAGVITRTQVYHSVDTEAGAATDDLDTISGGAEGDLLIIRAEDSAHTVVVKTGTGNIILSSGADISLDDSTDHLLLIYDGTNWCDDFRAVGGGGAPVNAEYLTLALDGTLTNERRFVPGAGLAATDGGAGGDYTPRLQIDLPTRIVYATLQLIEYATIQAAIDACATNDVILIPPGAYTENLTCAVNSLKLVAWPALSGSAPDWVYAVTIIGTLAVNHRTFISSMYITDHVTMNDAAAGLIMENSRCAGNVLNGGTAGDLALVNSHIVGTVNVDALNILGGWIGGARTVAGATTFYGEVQWAKTVGNHAHAGVAGDGAKLDWDDVWTDAVHSHLSNAEGGVICNHAHATTNAGQSIPNAEDTRVVFGTEVYDTGSEYAPATGIFTAGRSGYLHVTAGVTFVATTTWAATEVAVLCVAVNGSTKAVVDRETDHSTANINVFCQGSCTIPVTAGQTVDVKVYQNSGAGLALFAGHAYNWVNFDWMP